MARMRRINVVIDAELDDRLERAAADRGMSKSAVVRRCLTDRLGLPYENGLRSMPVFDDVEPIDDIDALLYGPAESPS